MGNLNDIIAASQKPKTNELAPAQEHLRTYRELAFLVCTHMFLRRRKF
ncbi:hypothetical protein CCP1ISM_40024 [Azospirillaceae bacterium]